MPLDLLDEHRKMIELVLCAYSEVEAAGERFFQSLDGLPQELQLRVLSEVTEKGRIVIRHPASIPHAPAELPKPATRGLAFTTTTPTHRGQKLPNPRQVIISILRSHPEGIALADIQQLARGKFATASKNPSHVLRTILSQLRKAAYVEQDQEGLHKLTPFYVE